MKKIKYQGGITKFLMSRRAMRNKKKFAKLSDEALRTIVQRFDKKQVSMEVASLSSATDLYEQVLSILSYWRFIGAPISWTVFSDGSHTEDHIQSLESVFPFVKVTTIDFNNPDDLPPGDVKEVLRPYYDQLLHYAQNFPYGKKLFYYLNYKIQNPTLFMDSDILFYELASEAFEKIEGGKMDGWFLPDYVYGCLDRRYNRDNHSKVYQVNAGFFLLNRELKNLEGGLEFLNSVQKEYQNFTEQTVFHIIFNENNFYPFDPRVFILNSSDQFDFAYNHKKDSMAMRHYTGPVRHKMWQRDWKWQLSLNSL